MHAPELREAYLGATPEALDAVDVRFAAYELILGMIDPEVTVANFHEPVITPPTIGVDDLICIYSAANYTLWRGF